MSIEGNGVGKEAHHWVNHLVAHPRTALFVEQVKLDALILNRGMNLNRNETRPMERTTLPIAPLRKTQLAVEPPA